MAVAVNPDKNIRKAVYDLINNISVHSISIPCYDTRVTGSSDVNNYVLLTSQTKNIAKPNKCEYRWETSLLIEIYTRNSSIGNPGSRVFLNDIEQSVYTNLLPSISVTGFKTLIQNITFETQLETVTSTENIFRSFLRLNLTLI